MYQFCGCDKLLSSLKAVRQHITSSVKTNSQSRNYSATGRAVWAFGQADWRVREAPGSPAAPDSELQYFHRGLHRLRGPGPGYRIMILSGASEGLPLPVPSRTASLAGSESGAAAAAADGPSPWLIEYRPCKKFSTPERVPDHPTLVEGNIGGFPHHVLI